MCLCFPAEPSCHRPCCLIWHWIWKQQNLGSAARLGLFQSCSGEKPWCPTLSCSGGTSLRRVSPAPGDVKEVQGHRIVEWFGLGATLKVYPILTPRTSPGCSKPTTHLCTPVWAAACNNLDLTLIFLQIITFFKKFPPAWRPCDTGGHRGLVMLLGQLSSSPWGQSCDTTSDSFQSPKILLFGLHFAASLKLSCTNPSLGFVE